MTSKKKVFVGLSGGVDSSVAALRLKQQNYDVTGVFIKVWHPDFLVCNWEQERLDAMRVAASLDIPFLTCDAEKAYRDEVAKYFIQEYIGGRTPNPDVMCNQQVKFGAFLQFARQRGVDFIATGHYAQKITGPDGFELQRGQDANKDQSYFLWSLNKEQLAYSLFPIGDTTKDQIRKEARKANIKTATKKDSQGVCFLGHIDIKEFLAHYVDLQEGNVLDKSGQIIGNHEGALIYTIGQRQGFNITTASDKRAAYYVHAKDVPKNIIVVDTERPILKKENLLSLVQVELRQKIQVGEIYEAQTRYRQTPFQVKVLKAGLEEVKLEVLEETEVAASGQSCVLYRGALCLGGGIIV